MRRILLVISLASLILQSVAYADNLVVKPTTTLAQQTSNNTSTADSFKTQVNGNIAAGNVSKLDIHSLLYPGNHTKVYAHFMAWFGTKSHMNVGYDSTSRAQVARQVQDMISRGIDGVIIDWYGKGNYERYDDPSIDEGSGSPSRIYFRHHGGHRRDQEKFLFRM